MKASYIAFGIAVIVVASCCEVLAQANNNMRDLRDVARPQSGGSGSSSSNSSSSTEADTSSSRNSTSGRPNDYLDRNRVNDTLRPPASR